ncbi:helical backbone metal receptor [Candidatus Margulisiibacteriota bacterium]
MLRNRLLLFAIMLALLLIFPTSAIASRFNRVIYPVVVEDDSGYQFKMKKKPEKIISTMPGITEMLFSMKLGEKIIGVTKFCDYPDDAKEIEKIGGMRMNLEKIISLEADLIVMDGDAQKKDIQKFRKHELPVFVINPTTIEALFKAYEKLGIITANYHAAYSRTEWMKRKILWKEVQSRKFTQRTIMVGTEEVIEKFKLTTALVIISKRPVVAVGKNTFIDDMLRTIGVKNVIEGKVKYPKLGKEQIFKFNPDIIITTEDIYKKPEDVYKDHKYKHTSAGITKKVLIIDPDVISRPGPRLVTALNKIYDFVYNIPTTEVVDEKS